MARVWFLLILCAFCLAGHTPASAQPHPPRVILIVFRSLSAADLSDTSLPHLRELVRSGQTALMNTAVVSPRSNTAAVVTLALGTLAASEPSDADIFQADETVEGTTAANVYRRRIGALSHEDLQCDIAGAAPMVHLGWASLLRRHLTDNLIGSILEKSGRQGFVVVRDPLSTGNDGRVVGLFGVNQRGFASCGRLAPAPNEDLDSVLLRLLDTPSRDVALILGSDEMSNRGADLRSLDALLGKLQARGALRDNRLLLVSPHAPAAEDGAWDRLAVAVLAGPGLTPGLVSSPTTRTPGLIANIDIAPTLLAWHGLRPPASMTGHPISESPAAPTSAEALIRMDRKVYLNGRGLVPVFAAIAALAAAVLAWGLIARKVRRPSRHAATGVLALMAMPLATLVAAEFDFPCLLSMAGGIIFVMMACGITISLILRVHRLAPEKGLLIVAILTAAVLAVDALTGQRLVKFSLFSGYQLQGIRFYGIGNEFMGVLIGFGLLIAFLARMQPVIALAWFALLGFLLGWPGFGANAGGLVAATVAFAMGWLSLRGKRPGLVAFFVSAAGGLALALLFAWVDRALSGGTASHLGGSLSAANERGWQYLGEIVARKIAMNLRIVAHPAVLIAFAAVLVVVSLGSREKGTDWRKLAESHPGWRNGLAPAAWGALAALLFNDSGIVAALFLCGAFLASGVYLLFADGHEAPVLDPVASGTLID